ncbi:MAG: PcfJ domain-containing protein [Candidatus Methanoperedens sp.]|nr:PcfJ domain-containing protein [Candidatus Methanoperedens sp.]
MQEFLLRDEGTIEVGADYAIGMGNRRLQFLVFTVGPALFRTVGFDYLYQFLPLLGPETGVYKKNPGRVDPHDFPSDRHFENIFSHLLKFITPKKLIHLLSEEEIVYKMNLLEDTYDMLTAYSDPEKIPSSLRGMYPRGLEIDFKFKCLKEFHDKISVQYTIIKAEAENKDIPVDELFAQLDGMESKGLKIVVPRKTAQLSLWGKLLNICIASYGDKAARGETLLLGVEKEGQIKYCLEFYPHEIMRPEKQEIVGLITEEISVPAIESKVIRSFLPKIEERMAMVPADYQDEAGLYYAVSMRQFRGDRNGDPTADDRGVIEHLLNKWIMDNLDTFKGLMPGVIRKDYDAKWHENFIAQAANEAILAQGQPDQLIVNPQVWQNYQNILQNQEFVPLPPIENIVVDVNV